MQKKFEINQTKIKGGCQSGRKELAQNSKSDLPLVVTLVLLTLEGTPDVPSNGYFSAALPTYRVRKT